MLLALLVLLADAHLSVPKSVQEKRAQEPPPPSVMPLFANPALLDALGDLQQTPGAWVEYLVEHLKEHAFIRVRMSLLTEAAPAGSYWMEMDTITPGFPPQSARMLLHGSPAKASNIDRLEVLMLGQAPLEIPVSEMHDKLEEHKAKPLPKIEHGKPEAVEVRGGKFTAEPIKVGDTKLWRSSEVPLWGLVKAKSPREKVELLGSGREGAHTLFPDQGNGSESTK